MAAPLNKTRATVTTPAGTFEGVAVRIGPGASSIRVTKGMSVVAERDGVATNVRDGKSRVARHTITFTDGEQWTVVDERTGCKPCGR